MLNFLLIEACGRVIGNSERCDSLLYAELLKRIVLFLSMHLAPQTNFQYFAKSDSFGQILERKQMFTTNTSKFQSFRTE